jgi:hypothetical protein
MKRLVFFLSFLWSGIVSAQSWQWGIRGGGFSNGTNNTAETVVDIATDNAGNVYIASSVNADGLPTVSGYSQTTGVYGDVDILLTSYKCDGTFRWKKTIGGAWGDGAKAVATDTLGHIYLTGYAQNPQSPATQLHFDTDSIVPYNVIKSFFVVQYDTAGQLKWLRHPVPDTVPYQRQLYYQPHDMIVSKTGSVEILCYLGRGLLPNSNIVVDTPHAYILKYDALGNITGLVKPDFNFRQVAGNGFDQTGLYSVRISKTPTGKFIIAGTQTFYPFQPYSDTLNIGGQKIVGCMFVASFNSAGEIEWLKQNDTSLVGGFNYRPIVDNDGSIYLAGSCIHGKTFNGYTFINTITSIGYGMPMIVKLDASGNLLFARNGSTNGTAVGVAVALSQSKVYLAGHFPGTLKWDNYTLANPTNTSYDIFLTAFDKQTGTVVGVDSLKGPSGYRDEASVSISDNKNNVYIGGKLGSSFQVGSTNIQSAGGSTDFFVAKFGSASCSNTIVPLTLTAFSALLVNNSQVQCQWQTAQEINTSAFIIERSADGHNFATIAAVAAAGNSNLQHSYTFTDLSPFSNNSPLATNNRIFYRLKMLDKDGRFTYSQIAKVSLTSNPFIQLYPNPVKAFTNIAYNCKAGSVVEVYNMLGLRLLSLPIAGRSGTLQINTSGLASGTYNVVIKSSGVISAKTKMLVQNK